MNAKSTGRNGSGETAVADAASSTQAGYAGGRCHGERRGCGCDRIDAAEEMILSGRDVKLAVEAISSAEAAMKAAVEHFERVSKASTALLAEYRKGG
ncbi:hypothetical protein [Breoghania sp.]|uniref:hypothetical protein n=1 Tax=Breoghania sp. TaxID=2065378 RepID=UPI002625DEE7|nr:hypothetical protein [Breoghania sp.]MDJ0932405.1 hypothetical protein [Breoghania sp.]